MKITIERAIEILDPTHREHYDSIEPVNEACRMGMEALKEKLNRKITVADLDPIMPRYDVLTVGGRKLGEKRPEYGYMKPEYGKDGRRIGGKWCSFEKRKYKATPPWLKCEVAEIKTSGYGIGLFVRSEE